MTPGWLLDGGQDLGTILGQCDRVKAEATKQGFPELLISRSKVRVSSGSPQTESRRPAYTIAARGGRAQSPLRCLRDGTRGPAQWGRPYATHKTTYGRDPYRRVDARSVQRRRATVRRRLAVRQRLTVRRRVAVRRRVTVRRSVSLRRLVADRAALGSICGHRQDARLPGRRAFVPAT